MQSRAEQLFLELQNVAAIKNLIGQTEDVHFDCKEWPTKDEDAQKPLAKAACGLTNAEGGVLVIGMKARSIAKDDPDLVESAVPIADTVAVKSKILNLIGQLVEPGIEGINAVEVNDPPGSKSGFVIVYIPASEGFPRRSRKDWKFYLRIGSGTFPMEYFQIADMFGQRPRPSLELTLRFDPFDHRTNPQNEIWWIGLKNTGRAIAKFPGIRFRHADYQFRVNHYGIDGNGGFGLPRRPSEDYQWEVFRGGIDDVIYPETALMVAKLERHFNSMDQIIDAMIFSSFTFQVEISCEGVPTQKIEHVIPQRRINRP